MKPVGSRDGAVVHSSTHLPPMWTDFYSWTRRNMWVEFVVGSRPSSERFFSRYYGFPLSSKTNISTFQLNLDYIEALYHEPLAQEIVQVLPVFLTFLKKADNIHVADLFSPSCCDSIKLCNSVIHRLQH